MSSTESNRIWRNNQRALGLCTDCTEPVKPGHSRCAKHLEIDNARQQGKKEKRIKEGKCWTCGRPLERGGVKNCAVCVEPHHFNPMRGVR